MTPPLRVLAIVEGAKHPMWWITTDNGKTYTNTYGERITVTADKLSQVGHGMNDPQLVFPRARRVAFQAPRSYDG
jgi:hypothetical protein